jgi:hypothetical protein
VEQTSDAVGAANKQLRPVVLPMAAERKHRLGIPYRKIRDFFVTFRNVPNGAAASDWSN